MEFEIEIVQSKEENVVDIPTIEYKYSEDRILKELEEYIRQNLQPTLFSKQISSNRVYFRFWTRHWFLYW